LTSGGGGKEGERKGKRKQTHTASIKGNTGLPAAHGKQVAADANIDPAGPYFPAAQIEPEQVVAAPSEYLPAKPPVPPLAKALTTPEKKRQHCPLHQSPSCVCVVGELCLCVCVRVDVQSAAPRFLFVRGSARLLRGPSGLKTSVGEGKREIGLPAAHVKQVEAPASDEYLPAKPADPPLATAVTTPKKRGNMSPASVSLVRVRWR